MYVTEADLSLSINDNIPYSGAIEAQTSQRDGQYIATPLYFFSLFCPQKMINDCKTKYHKIQR